MEPSPATGRAARIRSRNVCGVPCRGTSRTRVRVPVRQGTVSSSRRSPGTRWARRGPARRRRRARRGARAAQAAPGRQIGKRTPSSRSAAAGSSATAASQKWRMSSMRPGSGMKLRTSSDTTTLASSVGRSPASATPKRARGSLTCAAAQITYPSEGSRATTVAGSQRARMALVSASVPQPTSSQRLRGGRRASRGTRAR